MPSSIVSPSPIDPSALPAPAVEASPARAEAPWRRVARRLAAMATRDKRMSHLFLRADGVTAWRAGIDEPVAGESAETWFAAHRGASVRIVLGGGLTRQILVRDPEAPLDDEDTLVAWARHQLAAYHGSGALTWPVATWIAPGQRIACALHGIDLGALRAAAVRHRVRLHSIEPAWSVALRSIGRCMPDLHDAPRHALALVESELVTWVRRESGRVVELTQRRLHSPTSASLAALVAELARSLPDEAPIGLAGYGLADSGPWLDLRLNVPTPLDLASPPSQWVVT